MTNPATPFDSSSPFEQQLKQLKPTPVAGLEEMLYQAGWAAALQAEAAKLEAGTNGRGSSRRPWLGFLSGGASGLVAASLLFVTTVWNGWLPGPQRSGEVGSGAPIAAATETGAKTPEAELGPTADVLATTERPRGIAGFNLLAWLDSGSEVFAPAFPPAPSVTLSTAPLSNRQLDRLLSVSGNSPASAPLGPDSTNPDAPLQGDLLQYRPGGNLQPELRF